MSNTRSAKAAAKREEERRKRKEEERKPLVIEAIAKCGNYSEDEKEFIYQINENVMSVDGTADGWGYNCNPLDYVETSSDIFDMAKKFLTDQKDTQ